MKNIICNYYDTKQNQTVESYPDLVTAIATFREFEWRPVVNDEGEAGIQMIMYNAVGDNNSSMQLSNSEDKLWCLAVCAVNRRRFCGPFFAKQTFKLFVEIEQSIVEKWIRNYFNDSLEEFTKRLEATAEHL